MTNAQTLTDDADYVPKVTDASSPAPDVTNAVTIILSAVTAVVEG